MLLDKVIYVPHRLHFEATIDFVNSFCNLRDDKKYIFDFVNTTNIDPFSLLYVSYKLGIFKENNPHSSFFARNFRHLTYPAHMGFFKSFRLPYGKEPGEASGSQTYTPIEIIKVQNVKNEAREMFVNPGVILDEYAENISCILTQNLTKTVTDVLRYSIREILRNIVEHSESEEFTYCAQYIPSLAKVQFAVLDKGIGLKQSLSSNPKVYMDSDHDAIKWSLKPGVSGKVYPGQKNKPKGDDWVNSGYGLYMTSNICKSGGGSFFISSGNAGLLINRDSEREFNLEMEGTAVYLVIDLYKIKDLAHMLKDFRDSVPKDIFVPSKSSMDKAKSRKF